MRLFTGIVISLVLCGMFMPGCKTDHRVLMKDTTQFADRSGKIPMVISLYVSPEARQYVIRHRIKSPFGGDTNVYKELVIGEALVPNASISLGKIFNRVVVDETVPASQRYYVELDVDPKTTMDVGKFTMSKKVVDLHLQCQVRTKSGTVLWKKVISSKSVKENPGGWKTAYWRPAGTSAANTKLKGAGEESLRICLETLNDELMKNRARLFR